MGRHSLLKILILALLVVPLGACDGSAHVPAPTPAITALDEVDTTPADTVTAEEIAMTATPVFADTPSPESEVTVQPPTIAAESPLPPLPDGPLTIVALGDSLTEGDGDWPGDGGGYPARLMKSINELRPGSQVINLGKSGWNSQQMVEGQLPAALQANPHIALIWIGSNNLWYNNGPGEGETLDLSNYTNDIDTALRSLTGAGARVFIALLDDQTLRPYSTADGGANFTPDQLAHMSHLVTVFNAIVGAKAAEYGVTTVDFYNTTIFTDPSTLSEDGIHANPQGHDLVAQLWFEAIRQIL